MKRLGVLGTMVWDTIHGRDPAQGPVEEWGGIAYSLAALDATLSDDWELVPLIKVGRDLAPRADAFLRTLRHLTPGTRFITVPHPNNRVTLHYQSDDRRSELLQGGIPGWTWAELGPLVRDLDALYINFISGFELDLEAARLLRRGFSRFIYADLHSLFLSKSEGERVLQPLDDAAAWFSCFDVVQLNEEEMTQLSADPMATAAQALGAGCRALCVTLGARGVVYFEPAAGTTRTARLAASPSDLAPIAGGDPTGCGDVFGATAAAALIAGEALEPALRRALHFAARNVTHRGATGLRDHLLGRLSPA